MMAPDRRLRGPSHTWRIRRSMPPARATEASGSEFIDDNGGGPGVRLRKSKQTKS